jgi:hypothetical protein
MMFRQTFLLGAIILLTLMLNITLIDIFYQMNAGALSQSVIMTIGIIFLLSIEYDRLINFFFKAHSNLQSINSVKVITKNIIRILAVLMPVLYNIYAATHP